MILPTLHLNGTSPGDLLRKFETAASAVSQAMDALQAAAPHGRDYYPQGLEAFSEAQREYLVRQKTLDQVRKELELLAWHVQEAIDAKNRQKAGP